MARWFKALLALTVLAALGACQASEPAPRSFDGRPNIIFLLADDLGYADLGVQGWREAPTPNIDRLARSGARMTDFYAAHSSCAPSRVGLLTGRYQHRIGFENNPGPVQKTDPSFGVPASTPMISERLKAAGYATGAVGKWHIGYQGDMRPTGKGFDEFYGFLDGAMAYTADAPNGLKLLIRGTQPAPMAAHTTEAFADEAVRFIRSHRDQPFFLHVAFNAPHAPMQSTAAYLERFMSEPDPRRRAYLAMMAALDDAVGRIVQEVEANGLAETTLIVFTSDNGAPTWQTTSSNLPLNGVKGLVLEGGIRVPTLFRWTGRIPAGLVLSQPGIGMDITATALAAAGLGTVPDLDGRNLLPVLRGGGGAIEERALFWRNGTQGAVRKGRWKAILAGDDWLLFDLASDSGERRDLAQSEPERLAGLRADYQAWSSSMSPARWEWDLRRLDDGLTREAGIPQLIRDYVAGKPVDPRPILYGGGPE
ncbi:MAG: sulfatase-like hydrolase/transferase [Alphaproteobacteria bacterium]|nr:sulfatase-like hydrolase/transferase [Alphaproteobacteria bacterium]